MENNFLVLLDSHTNSNGLYPLTKTRGIGSVPFFGKYRLVDITLTAVKNSGCENVGIFPNNNVRSLAEHVKSGRSWNLDKRKDGVTIFQSDNKNLTDEGITYTRLEQNIEYLIRSNQEYVVIGHTHTVHNIELKDIVNSHVKSGKNYTKVVYENEDTGFYVVNKSVLLDNVKSSVLTFEHNIEDSVSNSTSVNIYNFNGYFKEITNIKSYLDVSFELLDTVKAGNTFLSQIVTKDTLQKPTKYLDGSRVSNSIISDSCYIKGVIMDSIIFKSNSIGSNSTVDNTIMFNGCTIGNNVVIKNALIDKNVIIKDSVSIISTSNNPIYIKKGSVISESCTL